MSKEQKPVGELNIELYQEFQASITSLGVLVDLQDKRIDQLWKYVEMFVNEKHDERITYESVEFSFKNVKRWEKNRRNNYGDNPTLEALRKQIKKWQNWLRDE